LIQETVRRSDVELVAYAVMPNHLHLILVQGQRRLADYMQPLLRRIALRVQRINRRSGHVFERRFRHSVCADPEYFRNAVAYVHLNPVRAGLCREPGEYKWTSHAHYVGSAVTTDNPRFTHAVNCALATFATGNASCHDARVASYMDFLRWRLRMDAYIAAGGDLGDDMAPRAPSCNHGSAHWFAAYRPVSIRTAEPVKVLPDLGRIARAVLAEFAPNATVDWLRSGDRGRHLVRARREFILRARAYGYRPNQIARFVRVSGTTVSSVLAPARSA
jgi:REP element-mobilizing transposase RayT